VRIVEPQSGEIPSAHELGIAAVREHAVDTRRNATAIGALNPVHTLAVDRNAPEVSAVDLGENDGLAYAPYAIAAETIVPAPAAVVRVGLHIGRARLENVGRGVLGARVALGGLVDGSVGAGLLEGHVQIEEGRASKWGRNASQSEPDATSPHTRHSTQIRRRTIPLLASTCVFQASATVPSDRRRRAACSES
jgi:hypothetical protein